MIIMAVDLGKARTGLALSDESETFAFPKETVTEYNTEKLVCKICDFAKANGVSLIVVGLPVNMDATLGERAEECTRIGDMIREKSGKETVMWDERCSTVLAHRVMSDNLINSKKRKSAIDSEAAALILESYLSFRKNKKC